MTAFMHYNGKKKKNFWLVAKRIYTMTPNHVVSPMCWEYTGYSVLIEAFFS